MYIRINNFGYTLYKYKSKGPRAIFNDLFLRAAHCSFYIRSYTFELPFSFFVFYMFLWERRQQQQNGRDSRVYLWSLRGVFSQRLI